MTGSRIPVCPYRSTSPSVLIEGLAARPAGGSAPGELQSILAAIPDAVITADESGVIMSWNRAAESMFGYCEEEVRGRSIDAIVPPRLRCRHAAGMSRASHGERRLLGKTIELTAVRRDGTEFEVELSLADWTSTGGRRFAGIIRDISLRKAAERKAAHSRRELEREREMLHQAHIRWLEAEAHSNLGGLLAGILHELNSPLGATSCASDMVARLAERGEGRQEKLQVAARLVQKGLVRITEVLKSLESIQHLTEPAEGSGALQTAFDEAREGLLESMPAGLRLRLDLASTSRRTVASHAQLRFVFKALVDNAIQAAGPSGAVAVSSKESASEVRISIVDDGPGMTEEALRTACNFGFTRKESAIRMKTGLATVRSLVGALGGRLVITSKPGLGTRADVLLPLVEHG